MSKRTCPDRNVEAVRRLLLKRAQIGLKKYRVTTERKDLIRLDWLRHAQAEALDFAVYLQVLITREKTRRELQRKSPGPTPYTSMKTYSRAREESMEILHQGLVKQSKEAQEWKARAEKAEAELERLRNL